MKLNRIALFSIAAASFLFTACDKIDENDRLVSFDNGGGTTVSSSQHVVLVEDYTGQECPNCPAFAVKLTKYVKSSPDAGRIVMVAVHNDLFQMKESDFATQAGIEYKNWLGLNSLPVGVVDREVSNGKTVTSSDASAFLSSITAALQKPQVVTMFGKAHVTPDNKISTDLFVTPSKDSKFDGKGTKIMVWLIEDEVVAPQIAGGKKIEDFKHHHILRAALNGTWGADYKVGEVYTLTADIPESVAATVKDNRSNLKLVAFVYNDSDKSVVETIKYDLN